MSGNPLRVEPTEVVSTDGIAYLIDDLGFPCEACPRCAGRGELPVYSHNHGGVCFDCKGAGIRYPKSKAGTIAQDARAARRPVPLSPSDVSVGMTIRAARRHGEPDAWRTVADTAIDPTPWPGDDNIVDVHVITYTDAPSTA